jgi:extracellular factor (EF) 3-hydroxypalmitic acid methyl ester biosynthesis protein
MNKKALFIKNNKDKNSQEFINQVINNGGPESDEYEAFTTIVNRLEPDEIDHFRELIYSILNENTLIGHGYIKPFGYPGDFMLIDKIYHLTVNPDPKYKKWDLYFQNQAGADAVRNRKEYFLDYCNRLALEKPGSKVLILGSGPATDVNEFLIGAHYNNMTFDLVDFDQKAIDFSFEKNKNFNGKITYNKINALRFSPFKLYDLIWSAGLFDYFKDKHFAFLVKKYFNCLAIDGEMVISNFSKRNPNKRLMEVMSDWYLNHRSESDLFHITADANIDMEQVSIDKEPTGVNLFLKIKKN